MSIRIKMFLSSLLVVLLVGLTGFFGLRASKRSLDSLESGEKQSWHIVINSNNVSSNVKQSEFDLMLFLALGHPEDKEHYYENTKALTRQIAWLKQNVSIPQGLLLLQRISSGAEAFYPAAEALIKVHDEDRSTLGSFDAERHADLVRTLNNLASDVRENGVALANLQAASLSKHSAITAATEINSYAKRAGTHLLLFLTLNSLEDKSKFYQRCKSIQEQINILTSLLITPPAMAILERMKSDFAELSAAGKALIAAYDDEMKKNGRLAPENYSGLIVKLVSSCSALSQEGFALMEFEIKLQQDLDSGTKSYYGNIQSNIVLVSLVSLILILCFNFILSKKIADRLITLKKSLRAFGEGKLETVSASTVNDEIGELSRSFKKMAEDLRQTMVSRDYVENILKSMTNSLVVAGLDGAIKTVNAALTALLGYQEMELPGRQITTILELEPAQGWDSLCRDLHEGKVIKNAEKYFLHKKGAKIPVLFSASFLSAEGGIVCIAQDILELKRAEDEREKLAAAIEQARETVMIMGPDGAIQYVNQAIEKITGKTRQELIGHKIYLIVRYSEERYRDQFRQAWESITAGIPWLGTITEIKPDNSSIDLDLAITPVRDAQGAVSSIVSIGRDVTRERLLEAQLRQSQKMEAIGTLAGGIAHDFNNILAGILGFTEIVKDEVPQDSRAIYHLDQILKLGDRAVNLVRQILAFSRKAGSNRTPMQLSPLIKEVLNLLRATLPATIEMRQRLMDQGSIVEADPTQIHQVLMNLCTNAFHALQEKAGVLEVELTRVSLSREDIASDKDIEPGPYVLLKVSDTGEGIDQAIISRIFDPFFTTKDVGKGTGLGLSVVHGIIKAHGGDITVTSEPGKGTTFSILLPEVSAQGESKQEESSSEPLSGSEHILFVDDEEALSELAKELLEPFGYSVTAVQSGEEAIAIFQKAPEKFDLVITDLSMPHMTGYELAQELLRIKPGIPVILCTGNNETSSGIKEKDPNIKAVLAKPVNRNVLAETIRKVLNLF